MKEKYSVGIKGILLAALLLFSQWLLGADGIVFLDGGWRYCFWERVFSL